MTAAQQAPIRQTDADGNRFYFWEDPDSGIEHRFWSVTTALSALNKEALKFWTAKLAAQRAMNNIPMMIAAQRVDPCGRAYARTDPPACGRCPECVVRFIEVFHLAESERRKHEGSATHDGLEAFILKGVYDDILGRVVDDGIPSAATLAQPYIERHPNIAQAIEPYLATLRQFLADFDVRPADFLASEMKIFNETYQYGGTLDAVWRIVARNERAAKLVARITGRTTGEAVTVIVDLKTREGEGKAFYGEHALQLAAYRRATHAMPSLVDRALRPMYATAGAVLLQIRPDGYTCEPIRTEQTEFDAFLAALRMFQWTVDDQSAAMAVKTFPVPEGFKFTALKIGADGKTMEVGTDAEAPKKTVRKRAAKKLTRPVAEKTDDTSAAAAVQGSARMKSATVESIIYSGGSSKGATLRDEDIPF